MLYILAIVGALFLLFGIAAFETNFRHGSEKARQFLWEATTVIWAMLIIIAGVLLIAYIFSYTLTSIISFVESFGVSPPLALLIIYLILDYQCTNLSFEKND